MVPFFVILLSLLFLDSSNTVFAEGSIVINEFSVHPSAGNKEWVEIYNPDSIDLSNYWIDDDTDFSSDTGGSAKKRLDSIAKGSDEQHYVYELSSAMFNNSGDHVALFNPDGGLVDQYAYTDDPGVDVVIGRTPDATGDFQVLAGATKGSPNAIPQPPASPTPAPTTKPTKIPTATKTTTTTQSKTSHTASSANDKKTDTMIADSSTGKVMIKDMAEKTKFASNGAYPTPILGISSKSADKKFAKKPSNNVLVKSASSSPLLSIMVGIGGILMVVCGILVYLKIRNKNQEA